MAYKPCIYLENRGKRVTVNDAFACSAPDPELPPMPASITRTYRFSPIFPRSYVTKSHCAECPCYTPPAEDTP